MCISDSFYSDIIIKHSLLNIGMSKSDALEAYISTADGTIHSIKVMMAFDNLKR